MEVVALERRTVMSPSTLTQAAIRSRLAIRLRDRLAALRARYSLHSQLQAIVLLAMLPMLAISMADGWMASQGAQTQERRYMEQVARDLAGWIDHDIEGKIRALALLADRVRAADSGDARNLQRIVAAASLDLDGALTLHLPDQAISAPGGDGTNDALAPDALDDLRRQAILTGKTAVGGLLFTPRGHRAVVPIVLPIAWRDTLRATAELLLPAGNFAALLRRDCAAANCVAQLSDQTGRVVADNVEPADDAPAIRLKASEAPGAAAMLRWAADWRVTVVERQAGGLMATYRPLLRAALGAVLALILGFALVNLASRRLSGWLHRLSSMSRNVAVGSDWPRGQPELIPLAEFDELRRNLARADAVLRRRGAAERMALREARTGHELLVSVVNGTPEQIHVKDLDLRYVLVNRAALIAGPERRAEWQVLGKQTADLFPPELATRIEDADRRVLATGRTTSFEQEYLAQGEISPRWISMTIAPWQDAEGRVVGVVSVSRDVTPHRQAQVRLRKLQAELLRATRLSAMGAMASGLAHELNQPLAAATNYLNAGNRLLDRGEAGDAAALAAARGAVGDAAQQMLRAGAIVRRLRDFVDRGEVELQPENVEELLRETRDLAVSDGLPADIAVHLAVSDQLGQILVDRTQIGQVVLNLLRNAAEAIQSVDPPRPGEIHVSAGLKSGGVMIAVRDNGPGLAPGIADRLFEPFVSSKRTGMGIGLAICRTIVEGHGGKLTAEPAPDGGMIFCIVLPVMTPHGEIG
jgi:PAS domain S-box-containing protein